MIPKKDILVQPSQTFNSYTIKRITVSIDQDDILSCDIALCPSDGVNHNLRETLHLRLEDLNSISEIDPNIAQLIQVVNKVAEKYTPICENNAVNTLTKEVIEQLQGVE